MSDQPTAPNHQEAPPTDQQPGPGAPEPPCSVAEQEAEIDGLRRQLSECEGRLKATESARTAAEKVARTASESEADLARRARALVEREIEADAGFSARNRQALSKLEDERKKEQAIFDDLRQRVLAEQARLADGLQREIDTERARRFKQLEAELEVIRSRESLERERLRKELDERAVEDGNRIHSRSNDLDKREQALASRDADISQRERDTAFAEQEVRAARASAEQRAKDVVREMLEHQAQRIAQLKANVDELAGRNLSLEQQVDEFRRIDIQGGESKAELQKKAADFAGPSATSDGGLGEATTGGGQDAAHRTGARAQRIASAGAGAKAGRCRPSSFQEPVDDRCSRTGAGTISARVG